MSVTKHELPYDREQNDHASYHTTGYAGRDERNYVTRIRYCMSRANCKVLHERILANYKGGAKYKLAIIVVLNTTSSMLLLCERNEPQAAV